MANEIFRQFVVDIVVAVAMTSVVHNHRDWMKKLGKINLDLKNERVALASVPVL